MPTMRGETSIGASSTNENVLQGSDFEFLNQLSVVDVVMSQSAIGLQIDVKADSDSLAASVVPNIEAAAGRLIEDQDGVVRRQLLRAGSRLKIRARNTTGGALDLNWMVNITPVPMG